MLTDDLEPQKRPGRPKPLDPLSIEELMDYVTDLKTEILRVEAAIAAKRAHMASVAALFKQAE